MPLESTVPTNVETSPQLLDVFPVSRPAESIVAVQVEEVQPLSVFELVTVAVPDHDELVNGLVVDVPGVGVGVELPEAEGITGGLANICLEIALELLIPLSVKVMLPVLASVKARFRVPTLVTTLLAPFHVVVSGDPPVTEYKVPLQPLAAMGQLEATYHFGLPLPS